MDDQYPSDISYIHDLSPDEDRYPSNSASKSHPKQKKAIKLEFENLHEPIPTLNSSDQKTNMMTFGDIKVEFPFDPYESQKQYMEGVLKAMRNQENALMESPTGTGKTLTMLTSTLAWLSQYRIGHKDLSTKPLPTRIIYGSRTHTQLKQVVRELKNTCYRPVVATLASRDHLCCNTNLKFDKGRAKNIKCKELRSKMDKKTGKDCVKKEEEEREAAQERLDKMFPGQNKKVELSKQIKYCKFFNKNEQELKAKSIATKRQALDIEELKDACETEQICPFFTMKELANQADLVLVPYVYLTNRQIRSRYADIFKNAIIIIDEAHNIPKSAEDGDNVDISIVDVKLAIQELEEISYNSHPIVYHSNVVVSCQKEGIAVLKDELETIQERMEIVYQRMALDLSSSMKNAKYGENEVKEKIRGSFIDLLKMICNIDSATFLNTLPLDKSLLGAKYVITHNGIHPDKLGDLSERLGKLTKLIEEHPTVFSSMTKGVNIFKAYLMISGIHRVYKETVSVASQQKVTWKDCMANHYTTCFESIVDIHDDEQYMSRMTISLKCLNPGIAFQDLISNLTPKSILLTSGTLSPLDSFENELKVKFDVKMTCKHVIDASKQLFARVLNKSAGNCIFDFSFANRGNDSLTPELGMTLVKAFQATRYGVLVFFTSYQMMQSAIKVWKYDKKHNLNIWHQMAESKTICQESQDAVKNHAEVKKYFECYQKGAVFFAVFGGKLSEGIDFTDNMARLVVCVGIPFAAIKTPEIEAKKEYLTKMFQESPQDRFRMSFSEWYVLTAIRTMSQALGRIIRHKSDYGSILLIDKRMIESRHLGLVSTWIKNEVVAESDANTAIMNMHEFLENHFTQGNNGLSDMEELVKLANEQIFEEEMREEENSEEKSAKIEISSQNRYPSGLFSKERSRSKSKDTKMYRKEF